MMSMKFQAAIALFAVVTAAFLAALYVHERELRARADQVVSDQQKVLAESRAAQAANEKWKQDTLEEIRRQTASIKTPEQAARFIPQVIPGVQPVIVQVPAGPVPTNPELQTSAQPANPTPAPAHAEIPLEQLKTLSDFAQSCRECDVKLKAALTDSAELTKQMTALEIQRDAAVRALKGGTFLQRVKREGKSAIGAGAGAAGGAALCAKSSGPVIAGCAGIGALVGFVAAHL